MVSAAVGLAFMTVSPPDVAIFVGSQLTAVPRGSFFQARYEETSRILDEPAAIPEVAHGRLYVDADGRTRLDQESQALTTIVDPVANLAALIAQPEERVLWRSAIPRAQEGSNTPPSAPAEAAAPDVVHAEDLGPRLIQGIPCRGSRVRRPGTDAEHWIADELGIIVWSRQVRDGRETIYRLLDLQRVNPAPSLFDIPANLPLAAAGDWLVRAWNWVRFRSGHGSTQARR